MNTTFIDLPHIPTGKCSLIIAGGLSQNAVDTLNGCGVSVLFPDRCEQLPASLSTHADLLISHLGKNIIFAAPGQKQLNEKLVSLGFSVSCELGEPGISYPDDCKYNFVIIGNSIVYNPKCTKKTDALHNSTQMFDLIKVNQGYTKCSTAVVDLKAVITEDDAIAASLRSRDFDVLKIKKGYVKLDGYDYGFFGGCCGLISDKIMAFNGNIEKHPQGDTIKAFLAKYNKTFINLTDGDLYDIGSMIPLLLG